MATADSWPQVVENTIARLTDGQFTYAFFILLAVVVAMGWPFIRKLIRPAQTAAETSEAVARGVRTAINGDLKDIRSDLAGMVRQIARLDNHVSLLEHSVEKNRQSAKGWHEENSERLDKYDRVIDRLKPWDGTPERDRRKPPQR